MFKETPEGQTSYCERCEVEARGADIAGFEHTCMKTNQSKEIIKGNPQRAKEKGKMWGECSSCEQKTVLVAEVGLCGPCCFGEAETYNGNF